MNDIEQKQNPTNTEFTVAAPPSRPAVLRVTLSDDKTEAYLEMEPPENGGSPPTQEDLQKAIAERNVVYGVDQDGILRLASQPVYFEKVLIAKGIPPKHGENGTCSFLFNIVKNFKPKERPDGSIDFHDLDTVENVFKGQLLCTITLPGEGTHGISVTNTVLPARKGKPITPLVGKNVTLSDDGTSVLALIDGQAEFDGFKIHVNESLHIDNVDNSTGHIKVVGNLIIRGMILPGLSIEASGNIEVSGTVSSAKITAGGSIVLRSGMTGSELTSGGDLSSRFIENCTLFVRGSIKSEYILNSHIKCGKNVQVVGHHSKILGGSCLAGKDILAMDIGSQADVRTELELGADPEFLRRQQEITALIPELERQNQSLKPLIALLQQLESANRLTPDKKQLLDNVHLSYETNVASIAEAKAEIEKISDIIRNRGYGRVVCAGTIYPGTRVKIGNVTKIVNEPYKAASLYYSEGEIRQGSAF